MNKRRPPKQDSIFQKRGFYIALYSCVAVLLIAAIAITYSSLNEANTVSRKVASNEEKTEKASISPYVTPEDKTSVQNDVQVEMADAQEVIQNQTPSYEASVPQVDENINLTGKAFIDEAPVSASEKSYIEAEAAQTSTQTATPIQEEDPAQSADENSSENDGSAAEEDYSEAVYSSSDSTYQDVIADPVFKSFDGEQDMLWPAIGEIVMNYSVDKGIYDKTLNQYRTNDSICISASEGSAVKAAADGVVANISNSRENGNTIVIEHGNGWSTTYSQLNKNTFVSVGDVVSAGQEIGTVASPSIYYSLIGSHVSFKVAKDSQTVNPNMILVQK